MNASSGVETNASGGAGTSSISNDLKRVEVDERERKARELKEHNAELAKQVEAARQRKEEARMKVPCPSSCMRLLLEVSLKITSSPAECFAKNSVQ